MITEIFRHFTFSDLFVVIILLFAVRGFLTYPVMRQIRRAGWRMKKFFRKVKTDPFDDEYRESDEARKKRLDFQTKAPREKLEKLMILRKEAMDLLDTPLHRTERAMMNFVVEYYTTSINELQDHISIVYDYE